MVVTQSRPMVVAYTLFLRVFLREIMGDAAPQVWGAFTDSVAAEHVQPMWEFAAAGGAWTHEHKVQRQAQVQRRQQQEEQQRRQQRQQRRQQQQRQREEEARKQQLVQEVRVGGSWRGRGGWAAGAAGTCVSQ